MTLRRPTLRCSCGRCYDSIIIMDCCELGNHGVQREGTHPDLTAMARRAVEWHARYGVGELMEEKDG